MFGNGFWGNQHGGTYIFSVHHDASSNSTPEILLSARTTRLEGHYRQYYYKIDNTNLRIYIYVRVTGGNSYGCWQQTVLQTDCGYVPEVLYNQSLEGLVAVPEMVYRELQSIQTSMPDGPITWYNTGTRV